VASITGSMISSYRLNQPRDKDMFTPNKALTTVCGGLELTVVQRRANELMALCSWEIDSPAFFDVDFDLSAPRRWMMHCATVTACSLIRSRLRWWMPLPHSLVICNSFLYVCPSPPSWNCSTWYLWACFVKYTVVIHAWPNQCSVVSLSMNFVLRCPSLLLTLSSFVTHCHLYLHVAATVHMCIFCKEIRYLKNDIIVAVVTQWSHSMFAASN